MRAAMLDAINADYTHTARGIQSLNQLDVYAVTAYLVVMSVIIIAFNLRADILHGFLDPRIRYS
jgi:ABC-type dipeptide/oligopeptide/nickel transport system permease component